MEMTPVISVAWVSTLTPYKWEVMELCSRIEQLHVFNATLLEKNKSKQLQTSYCWHALLVWVHLIALFVNYFLFFLHKSSVPKWYTDEYMCNTTKIANVEHFYNHHWCMVRNSVLCTLNITDICFNSIGYPEGGDFPLTSLVYTLIHLQIPHLLTKDLHLQREKKNQTPRTLSGRVLLTRSPPLLRAERLQVIT